MGKVIFLLERGIDDRIEKSLVPKKVMVTRDGKTFQQTVYVNPNKDEPKGKPKPQTNIAKQFIIEAMKQLKEYDKSKLDFKNNCEWSEAYDKKHKKLVMGLWKEAYKQNAEKFEKYAERQAHFTSDSAINSPTAEIYDSGVYLKGGGVRNEIGVFIGEDGLLKRKPSNAKLITKISVNTFFVSDLPDKGSPHKLLYLMAQKNKTFTMLEAKKLGITWKENDNPGINWMRAMVAIKKYLKDYSNGGGSNEQRQIATNTGVNKESRGVQGTHDSNSNEERSEANKGTSRTDGKRSSVNCTINGVKILNSNAEDFYTAISGAKKNNAHSSFVSLYSKDEYLSNKTLLLEDGSAGVAITQDKDIVSVFKNPKTCTIKGVSHMLLIAALKNGGNKLDCYDSPSHFLPEVYCQHGFIPVCRLKFDRNEADPDWNYERDGEPDIIFFRHNGDSAEEVEKKYKEYPLFSSYSDLPYVNNYEEGLKMRDKKITDRKKSTSSKNNLGKYQELLDIKGKSAVLEQAKKDGIIWKENDNPGINWMRAIMAIKNHNTSSVTQTPPDKIKTVEPNKTLTPKTWKKADIKIGVRNPATFKIELPSYKGEVYDGYGVIKAKKGKQEVAAVVATWMDTPVILAKTDKPYRAKYIAEQLSNTQDLNNKLKSKKEARYEKEVIKAIKDIVDTASTLEKPKIEKPKVEYKDYPMYDLSKPSKDWVNYSANTKSRVNYNTNTKRKGENLGEVINFKVSGIAKQGLMVHKTYDSEGNILNNRYTITHVPSGLSMATTRLLKDAKILADEVIKRVDTLESPTKITELYKEDKELREIFKKYKL